MLNDLLQISLVNVGKTKFANTMVSRRRQMMLGRKWFLETQTAALHHGLKVGRGNDETIRLARILLLIFLYHRNPYGDTSSDLREPASPREARTSQESEK